MTAPLGVAVIGADPSGRGFGARAHVPAIVALPDLRLVAVCTAHEDTATRAAGRWGAERAYADFRAAVADPDVDLVTVSVRVRLHRAVVEAALEAGKAVYCEWPLALDRREAEQLAALAARRGIPTGVGTQARFSPVVAAAAESIRRGDIGRPLAFHASQLLSPFAVTADRWWLAREDEASGALHVATAHVLDVLGVLLGPIESLAGARATQLPDDRYADTDEAFRWSATDTVACSARTASGTLGSLLVANVARPESGFALDVLGEEGRLSLAAPGYVQYTPARATVRSANGGTARELAPAPGSAVPALEAGPSANVAHALAAFSRAIADGLPFSPDFDDAVALHRCIEAIAASDADGGWVRL